MSTATSGLPVRAASGSSTARAVTWGCSRCPRRMSATSIGAGTTGQTYISPPRPPCTGSISELQGIGRATWGRLYGRHAIVDLDQLARDSQIGLAAIALKKDHPLAFVIGTVNQ